MSDLIPNFFGGQWRSGCGAGAPLLCPVLDPVLGSELVRGGAGGLDLAAGFAFALTLGTCAKLGETLGERRHLLDGEAVRLGASAAVLAAL